jgi:hypothetical protein
LKCDEKRPICARCEKGSRECAYPRPPSPNKSGKSKCSQAKQADPEYSSEEYVEEFNDLGEDEKASSSSAAVVKFSSALSPPSSSDSNDPFETLHLDDQMLIDLLTPPSSSFPMAPLFSSPPITFATIFGSTPPSTYSQSLHLNSPSSTWSKGSLCIPPELSLRPSRDRKGAELEAWITRLLDHHRREITHAHYFQYYDYPKFFTEIIFALCDKETEPENPLRIAVAAFSALNRSIRQDQSWRPLAFIFYGGAVQRLHTFLHKPGMDLRECQIAVATALELASFDVRLIVFGFLMLAIHRRHRKEFSPYHWGRKDTATSYASNAIQLHRRWTCPSRILHAGRRLLLFPPRIQGPVAPHMATRKYPGTGSACR